MSVNSDLSAFANEPLPIDKTITVQIDSGKFNVDFYRLRRNDFPYYTVPSVEHYLLWALRPLTEEEIETALDREFGKMPVGDRSFYNQMDKVWFVNPVNRKSIPGVWHCHIFVHVKKQ